MRLPPRMVITTGLLALLPGVARAAAPAPSVPPLPSEEADLETRPGPTPVPQLDVLSFHKANYFLSGATHDTQVKFQFSIKYNLWPNRTRYSVHFGYTQMSLWDLWTGSAPFRETNYNPEVFVTRREYEDRPPRGLSLWWERLGLEHESNGLGGDDSRGWNRLYVSTRIALHSLSPNEPAGDRDDYYVIYDLKVWIPFGAEDGNANITSYLGYAEAGLHAGLQEADNWFGNVDVGAVGRKGTRGRGSVQIDARWRPGYGGDFVGWLRFTPYLYVQYFDGDGESLLTYDRGTSSLRVGVGFSDRTNWN